MTEIGKKKTQYPVENKKGRSQVYEWFSRLTNSDISFNDKPRSGRQSTTRTDGTVQTIRELVVTVRRLSENILELVSANFNR